MKNPFRLSVPVITFTFGLAFCASAWAGVANPTGLASLPAAAGVNDTDTFAICQNGPGSCTATSYTWSNITLAQIDSYLGSRSMSFTNKTINGANNTLINIPAASLTGIIPAIDFPALTGDVSSIGGSLIVTLQSVNSSPGSTTCSNVTTDAKGRVTSNASGACGSSYTAGTGLQLTGSQFFIPNAGITSALLGSGAAVANIGFTPLNPANNLSEVNAALARTNLNLGSLATLSALPTTSLTGTLQSGQFPALTGDITTTAGSFATTLKAGAAVSNLGFTPLNPANNLSELPSASAARGHLGLGSLAILSALPAPQSSVLGGTFSLSATTHQFLTGLNTSGAFTAAQPDFSDLTGSATATQLTTPLAAPPPIGTGTPNTVNGSTMLAGNATANPIPSYDGSLLNVTGVVNSGTLINNNGIGVFVNDNLASVGPGSSQNVVLYYGVGIDYVNSAWTWGLNPVLADAGGITGAGLANELDFNVGNAGTTVYGLLLQGASTAQPTGVHPAFEIAPLDVQDSPPHISWSHGLETLDGAAAIGVALGRVVAGPSASSSQPIYFYYGTGQAFTMSVSSVGNLTLTPTASPGNSIGMNFQNNTSNTVNTGSSILETTIDGQGEFAENEIGGGVAQTVLFNSGAGGINILPGSGGLRINSAGTVSCAAGTVSLATLVISNGLATHC